MGRYIMNNLVYDTQKSEKVASGYKRESVEYLGVTLWRNTMVDLFRTLNGRYFFVYVRDFNRGKTCSEEEAKRFLQQYNYEKYVALYGALEEA